MVIVFNQLLITVKFGFVIKILNTREFRNTSHVTHDKNIRAKTGK